jgi:hypothetical protein
MMARIAVLFLAVAFSVVAGQAFAAAVSTPAMSECFGGRKTVTVYADSEAAAMAEANRKNPGWLAVSAKKTGGGKAYQVTMTKD